MAKENKIYKEYLVKEQFKFSFDKLQDMIKHSERDLIEWKKAEKEDQNLQKQINIRRESIKMDTRKLRKQSVLKKFFESG